MADQVNRTGIREASEKFRAVNRDKVLRPDLGGVSLKAQFEHSLEELDKKIEIALGFCYNVANEHVSQVADAYNSIAQMMENLAKRDETQYVAERQNFIQKVNSQINRILMNWPAFVVAQVEASGLLDEKDPRKVFERTLHDIRKEADKSLSDIKEKSLKIITEAEMKAKQVVERARKTATGISVDAAQKQFKEAEKPLWNKTMIWAGLSVILIIAFLYLAYKFLQFELPKEWGWHSIYFTVIRITILTVIGAVATFCLRIFRAYMHMYEHNQHRQRVTNSMAAFVESAYTPEQRDLILGHLVDAITSFGTSGLLRKEDDSIHPSKMVIDNIMR